MNELYPEELSAVAGVILSLGVSYLPGVKERFEALTPTQKRLVMLGLLFAAAAGIFAVDCLQPGESPGALCTEVGSWQLARIFAIAVIANQAAFDVSPKLKRKGRLHAR